jgi:hypothetical protein
MVAMEVTSGDGFYESKWIKLEPNQFVLCWRVLHPQMEGMSWGIYGIVDQTGLPIVMTDKGHPKPTRPTSDIRFFDRGKKKPPASEPLKQA